MLTRRPVLRRRRTKCARPALTHAAPVRAARTCRSSAVPASALCPNSLLAACPYHVLQYCQWCQMDFGTSASAAQALHLTDDFVRHEMKKLNLNANVYQLEKTRCCKRFNLEAESVPAVLFYRIMGHDWDRTAAQFEKARGRMRVRKRPVLSAEWRLQKRQAIMSDILEEEAAAAPAAAPHASGAHAGELGRNVNSSGHAVSAVMASAVVGSLCSPRVTQEEARFARPA